MTRRAFFGKREDGGGLAAQPMDDLGRRPDRHRIVAPVIRADDAAAFQWHRGIAMVIEAAFEAMRRAGERPRGIALSTRNSPIRLVSKRSWTIAAPGRNAASGSMTAGSSSRSSVTSSAASSASYRLSATMIATASPTWRTLSWASSGWRGLRNLCWTIVVHFFGSEIWPSGTGGSISKRSAPLSTSTTPGAAAARDKSTPRIGHAPPGSAQRRHGASAAARGRR